MPARRRCILLAGAPTVEELKWDETALLAGLDAGMARILNGEPETYDPTQDSSIPSSAAGLSKWRSVEMESKFRHGLSKDRDAIAQTQFLSFHDTDAEERSEHLDFLEHSIAAFDDLVSSQILQGDKTAIATDDLDQTVDFTTSFATSSATDSFHDTIDLPSDIASPTKAGHARQNMTFVGSLSNLEQIPSADYISSILPQTMTVNLLIGAITISPTRTVRLRKSNAEMDIVEVIVGDETRAGFTVSFWMAPVDSQSKPADDLRQAVQRLRAGDVLLLRNVALSCFRNCVYGQSLSKRFARNSTSVTVMDDDSVPFLPSALQAKLRRVRDWVSEFVGMEKKAVSSASSDFMVRDVLPPDTPI